MFTIIFSQELKYWSKNPSVYVYSLVLFLLATGTMAGTAGIFGEDSTHSLLLANSPEGIYSLMNLFLKLLLFIIPAIIGNSVCRDYRSNMYKVLYTYPFTKITYLLAKFSSAYIVVFLIALVIGAGFVAGANLPGVVPSRVTAFDPGVYVHIYGVYILPNVFFFGLVVFAITLLSRNLHTGFISVVVLLVLRETAARVLAREGGVVSLFDPLGEWATLFYTRHHTVAQQNQLPLPLGEWIIFNRLLWIGITALLSIWVYKWFSFSQQAFSFRVKNKRTVNVSDLESGRVIKTHLPEVKYQFSFFHQLKTAWEISDIEFRSIVKSGSFISILAVGVLFTFILLFQMNPPYGARIMPFTWVMLAFPVLFYSLLIQAMTFLYAGILVHRPTVFRMNEWVDATPAANVTLLLSRFLALVKMQVLLLSLIMVVGILVQAWLGFYQFEIGHYLFDLLGIHLIGFVIWAFAAVLVQTIFTNPYLGLFALIIGSFGISNLPALGVNEWLFRFNENPDPSFFLKYSDLSGYGYSLTPYFLYKIYWSFFGLILFGGALLFWIRGLPQSFAERISVASSRMKGNILIYLGTMTTLFMSTGLALYQAEHTGLKMLTENETSAISREADRKYGRYVHFLQPRIVSVKINMELFPESFRYHAEGEYTMVNVSEKVIDTLLIHYAGEVKTSYHFDQNSKTLTRDTVAFVDIVLLENGLQPGDSMRLHFAIEPVPATILIKNTQVEKDGTFMTSVVFPGLGYESHDIQFSHTDASALQNHYRSIDSDYIDFEATVSTSDGHTAIAPGYLQKEWRENGRHYFSYKSREKVTNDYVFLSGLYEVKREKWNGKDLEIFYHKGHAYNLGHMMRGLKATLSYNENHFAPYQHKKITVVEFSRALGEYAQSFANTIPYTEIGFVLDIDTLRGLNFPFIGVAHELSHQWWGHQVVPAGVTGSRMITEGLAEYTSLKVLEQEFGEHQGRMFREKALKIYLKNRAEDADEQPLMYNTGLAKSYIPYQKGSLVFYAMCDYLGEEKFHHLLKAWLEKVRFQCAPYATSAELVDFIQTGTPDSLQYLIHDLFETVTSYDNQMLTATAHRLGNGKYQVDLAFAVRKFGDDDRLLADYIEIGIFTEPDHTGQPRKLYLQKHKITQTQNTLTLIVDEMPLQAGIDPMIKLIDNNPADNMIAVQPRKK
ncbi:MAG: M1 family aminopeptidase [Bacteroidia bacterium]